MCALLMNLIPVFFYTGSDVNKPDKHGKTPLHLAHSRLRILRIKGGDESVQTTMDRKRETESVR